MSFHRVLITSFVSLLASGSIFAADDAMTANPSPNTTTMQQTTTTTTNTTTTKVNINTATAKQLLKVKGINNAKARAIIAYRHKNGNFKAVEDLANIKAFKHLGEEKLQAIENQLSIE